MEWGVKEGENPVFALASTGPASLRRVELLASAAQSGW